MKVFLTPELEQFIDAKVASGRYSCPSEVVCEGLRLLQDRDLVQKAHLERLRQEIQVGLDQLDRGEYVEFTDTTFEEFFNRIKVSGKAQRASENGE